MKLSCIMKSEYRYRLSSSNPLEIKAHSASIAQDLTRIYQLRQVKALSY